jgi:CheY-like chemotaxis protein
VQPAAATIRSGSGRVLLMDDDRIIRLMGEKLLKFLGYTTTLASGGSEALTLYKEALAQNQRFDCVVLDLTVPGDLGGLQTIQQLVELDPAVVALVSSGYSEDPIMSNFADYGFKGCIRKPYDMQQLSEALAKTMQVRG